MKQPRKNPFLISVSHIIVFFLVLGAALSSCANNEDLDINNSDEFDEFIRDEMSFQKIPALSLLIFKDQGVLHEGYFGNTDLENNITLQKNHPFLLASISKTITATALLQLYDQGRFALNDPINDYLPFDVSIPGQNTAITFKMLLTHTSGIADGSALDDQYYFGEDSPIALKNFLQNYLTPGGSFYSTHENFYDFAPGTRSEYSNIGNALIGLLVEEISGMEFNTYCKENIFIPLGMTHTFWRLSEALASGNDIVKPYEYSNGQYRDIGHYTFTDYPNGGLRSTAIDLSKFLSAFASGGLSEGFQLLKSETVQQVITLQIPELDNEMGLHFYKVNPQFDLWGHDGGEQGVSTVMGINPETRIGVIILTNHEDIDLEEILNKAYKLGVGL